MADRRPPTMTPWADKPPLGDPAGRRPGFYGAGAGTEGYDEAAAGDVEMGAGGDQQRGGGAARRPQQPPQPPGRQPVEVHPRLRPRNRPGQVWPPYSPEGGGPPVQALRRRLAPVALLYFLAYAGALVAYLVIRLYDLFGAKLLYGKDKWYSFFVLIVEIVGASALLPYAFANTRHTLPVPEDDHQYELHAEGGDDDGGAGDEARSRKEAAQVKQLWSKFGVRTRFDVFVIVPCYKESWRTIKRTLMCAMFARVPPGCRKHIIVGNDGHDVDTPNCQARRRRLAKLQENMQQIYQGRPEWTYKIWESTRIKGRQDANGRPIPKGRIPGNGKSLNLNHCIKHVIPEIIRYYSPDRVLDVGQGQPATLEDVDPEMMHKSVVVVFDVDMAVNNDNNETQITTPPRNGDRLGFFCKILRVLEDDSLDLVLTPQFFTNVDQYSDIFNHLNPQFWEYILPGLQPLGYVACTGTNMGLRLSMLHRHSPVTGVFGDEPAPPQMPSQGPHSARYEASLKGPFPTYSVTEDYALSLELRKAHVKGTYIAEYMVRGEAPDGIYAVDVQRGRWTEGHWQIFFSLRNPIFSPFKLGFWGTLYYNYGTWAYLCNIITIWVYALIPLLSALNVVQPVAFSERFRWAVTFFLLSTLAVQYYAREAPHFFGMWRANMSNVLLSWTYTKAILRAMLRFKAEFATHTETRDLPGDPIEPCPPMHAPPPDRLVNEGIRNIAGQLAYFSLLLLISVITIAVSVYRSIANRVVHSDYVLPAAWAVYNMIGPLLFFCAAFLKQTKSLQMAMYLLKNVHSLSALMALSSVWFINSTFTCGEYGAPATPQQQ